MTAKIISTTLLLTFLNCLILPSQARPLDLVALACKRNPVLAMCDTQYSDLAPRLGGAPDDFRTKFFENEDDDDYDDKSTRYMRSFPKTFRDSPVQMKDSPMDDSSEPEPQGRHVRDSVLPLVLPPPLPSASQAGVPARDAPITSGSFARSTASDPTGALTSSPLAGTVASGPLPAAGATSGSSLAGATAQSPAGSPGKVLVVQLPTNTLSLELVKTCTPDCTAPHCTVECKCAYSHADVDGKCNPPIDAQFASLCQEWYRRCPSYKPIEY